MGLLEFALTAWKILEPAEPFLDNWHLHCFAEHAEAISLGRLPEPNLLVNTPPGTTKSLFWAVLWPAWEWTWAPWTRWLTLSYDESLALRDAVRTRRLMQSDWYRRHAMSEPWDFVGDQNVKGNYVNDKTGWRIATSIKGAVTGNHALRVMCLAYNVPVTTDMGDIPIGDIVERQLPVRVRSFDHRAGVFRWSRIEAYERNPGRESVRVRLSNGRSIEGTEDHPVYVPGVGYRPLATLTVGTELAADNAPMRGMRSGRNEKSGAHGTSEGQSLLLAGVSSGVDASTGRSSTARSTRQPLMRGMRHRNAAYPTRAAPSVLLESVSDCSVSLESAAAAIRADGYVSDVWSDSDAAARWACWQAQFLLAAMREPCASDSHDGREQRQLSDRAVGNSVRAGIYGVTAPSGEDSRRVGVRSLRPGSEVSTSASYRRLEDQPRPSEPSDALYPLSSNGSFPARACAGVDEPVWVVAVERISTPDAVYNVRVADDHNYFAAGVLVHNCDDPHSVRKAESDAERESTLTIWRETIPSRVLPSGTRVMVGQRTHEEDATADWLAREGADIHHIELKMEYEKPTGSTTEAIRSLTQTCTLNGKKHDPRTSEGELMVPQRFPAGILERRKIELGPYAFASQFQQTPTPRKGMVLDPSWFPQTPKLEASTVDLVAAFDLNYSDVETSDWTVGLLGAVERTPVLPRIHLVSAFRDHLAERDHVAHIGEWLMLWKPKIVGIEKRAYEKQGAARDLCRQLLAYCEERGFTLDIEPIDVDTDKISRAMVIPGRAQHGLISIDKRMQAAPRGDLYWPILSRQMSQFPRSAHDDDVDALAHLVRLVIEKLERVRSMQQLVGKSADLSIVETAGTTSADWRQAAVMGLR